MHTNHHYASLRPLRRPQTIEISASTFLLWSIFVGACGVMFASLALFAQQMSPPKVTIHDGTIIRVVLIEPLSSATQHTNDLVRPEVAEDVKVNGVSVIAKGAPVTGHIVDAQPKGKWGKSGKLDFSVDYAKAVDRNNVRLRSTSSQGGDQKTGALMLGLSGAFVHGKDVEVPKGTSISPYVDGDREITVPTSGF